MSQTWAIQLAAHDAACLGPLRQWPGVELCEQPDALWVFVPNVEEPSEEILKRLPGRRYLVLADYQLVPADALVPKGYLPTDDWVALSTWMQVQLPNAGFAAKPNAQVALRLVRGGPAAEANLLLTTLVTWQAYACSAPQVRLDRWTFAVNAAEQVVVRGTPLPPVIGTHFVEQSGVATPAGWTWEWPLDPQVIRSVFQLEPEDLALVHADGSWDEIRAENFVKATRSAVRLSAGAER